MSLNSTSNLFTEATVNKSEKNEVRKIKNEILKTIENSFKAANIFFIDSDILGTVLDGAHAAVISMLNPTVIVGHLVNLLMRYNKLFRFYQWQILGIIDIHDEDLRKLLNQLNEEYKEELGKYEIVSVPTTLSDLNKIIKGVKHGFTIRNSAYFLIINNKSTIDFKKKLKAVESKKDDKKETTETELKESVLINRLHCKFFEAVNIIDDLIDE